jgi:hypothetical protein
LNTWENFKFSFGVNSSNKYIQEFLRHKYFVLDVEIFKNCESDIPGWIAAEWTEADYLLSVLHLLRFIKAEIKGCYPEQAFVANCMEA